MDCTLSATEAEQTVAAKTMAAEKRAKDMQAGYVQLAETAKAKRDALEREINDTKHELDRNAEAAKGLETINSTYSTPEIKEALRKTTEVRAPLLKETIE